MSTELVTAIPTALPEGLATELLGRSTERTGGYVHNLGTGLALGLSAGWLLCRLLVLRQGRRVRRRLAEMVSVVTAPEAAQARRYAVFRGHLRRLLPVAGAMCAGWVLAGGVLGLLLGAAVGVGLRWWRNRREAAIAAEETDAGLVAGQLPLTADLLAACIAAGAGPVAAAQAVGDALGGPVGRQLVRGAAEVRLGGQPADAWRGLVAIPGAASLGRLLERADESGLPAAGPVARLAAEARAGWGRSATERARKAAVMVTVPVGLCFLPAFIAVGVLPVVIGLAGGLTTGAGP